MTPRVTVVFYFKDNTPTTKSNLTIHNIGELIYEEQKEELTTASLSTESDLNQFIETELTTKEIYREAIRNLCDDPQFTSYSLQEVKSFIKTVEIKSTIAPPQTPAQTPTPQ